jgi:hypothetical protein
MPVGVLSGVSARPKSPLQARGRLGEAGMAGMC